VAQKKTGGSMTYPKSHNVFTARTKLENLGKKERRLHTNSDDKHGGAPDRHEKERQQSRARTGFKKKGDLWLKDSSKKGKRGNKAEHGKSRKRQRQC